MALGGLGDPGPGRTWQIFGPDGEPLRPVSLPPDLRPTFIGAERVVGVSRDALGVESVRVHALVRNYPTAHDVPFDAVLTPLVQVGFTTQP